VWGQVRPRGDRQPYRLQVLRDGGWDWVGPQALTDARGVLTQVVVAAEGTRLRLWSPIDRAASPPLVVR
jgi:hypothetical protein